MGNRTWIKIYCDKWIAGTLRQESVLLRGIWIDILTLAGNLSYGDVGEIKLPGGKSGLTDEQIVDILGLTSMAEWLEVKQRLVETDRIRVKEKNIIQIVNWKKYQSDYRRQSDYRKATNDEEKVKEIGDIVGKLSDKMKYK